MNYVHLAEAGLGLIASYELIVHYLIPKGIPAVWGWLAKKSPKVTDEAKLIFGNTEAEAAPVVAAVEADVAPAVHAVKDVAAPVIHAAEAVVAPAVAQLDNDAASVVSQVRGWIAAKDAEIADLEAKTKAAKTQRAAVAGQLQGV